MNPDPGIHASDLTDQDLDSDPAIFVIDLQLQDTNKTIF
jgi:hypothetical protein